jgi:hypothetical protein
MSGEGALFHGTRSLDGLRGRVALASLALLDPEVFVDVT